jgi:hypothetical protein
MFQGENFAWQPVAEVCSGDDIKKENMPTTAIEIADV